MKRNKFISGFRNWKKEIKKYFRLVRKNALSSVPLYAFHGLGVASFSGFINAISLMIFFFWNWRRFWRESKIKN